MKRELQDFPFVQSTFSRNQLHSINGAMLETCVKELYLSMYEASHKLKLSHKLERSLLLQNIVQFRLKRSYKRRVSFHEAIRCCFNIQIRYAYGVTNRYEIIRIRPRNASHQDFDYIIFHLTYCFCQLFKRVDSNRSWTKPALPVAC